MAGELDEYASRLPKVRKYLNEGYSIRQVDLIDRRIQLEQEKNIKYVGGKLKKKRKLLSLKLNNDEFEELEKAAFLETFFKRSSKRNEISEGGLMKLLK